MRERKILLVCDLDNTLYDWVGYFVRSFYAMVDKFVEMTGCDKGKLLDDFRQVHQAYHDSEQPFSLLETATVRELFPGLSRKELLHRLEPAFQAFNSCREKTLKLHDGVTETLEKLTDADVIMVAHSESRLFSAVDRLRRLGLIDFFSRVYCRKSNSKHPDPERAGVWLNDFPMDKIVELSRHQAKPSVSVLNEICSGQNVSVSQAAYIGDSIARDVLMAKKTGVFSIWAAYGANHDPNEYEKLVRITHWTPADVKKEKRLQKQAKRVKPDYVAERSFSEILPLFLSNRRALKEDVFTTQSNQAH